MHTHVGPTYQIPIYGSCSVNIHPSQPGLQCDSTIGLIASSREKSVVESQIAHRVCPNE